MTAIWAEFGMAEVSGLSYNTILRLALGEAPKLWPATARAAMKLRVLLPESAEVGAR